VGIRQTLNDNPVPTTAVTAAIMLGALFFMYRMSCSSPSGSGAAPPAKRYFTIDDGKSYFPDDGKKIPPFTHQGKQAYRVMVYKCSDGNLHVSHLERFKPADKKRIEDAMAAAAKSNSDPSLMGGMMFMGSMEIKKPGEKEWISMSGSNAEKYTSIMQHKCPDGSNGVAVFPE
jgi:hypothetical protein